MSDWRERAACRGKDPNLWFPERGDPPHTEALMICSGCSVRAECLDYAIDNRERFGIWGGESVPKRWRHRRRAA